MRQPLGPAPRARLPRGLAHDGREAAEQLKDIGFKVVLIDMKLPDGDGGARLPHGPRGNPQARTIVITGHRSEMDELIDQMLAEGADAVCYKPFDVPALLDRLGGAGRAQRGGDRQRPALKPWTPRRRWTSW